MNYDLGKGGHLSSQPMGALFNFVDTTPGPGQRELRELPGPGRNPYRIDEPECWCFLTAPPEMVVFGKSMFLYTER
jgi:hypothetical protein